MLRLVSIFLLSLAWSAANEQPVNAPLLPLTELKAGQHGEVWTVFSGTQPEPFDEIEICRAPAVAAPEPPSVKPVSAIEESLPFDITPLHSV